MRLAVLFFVVITVFTLGSCKKDLLHFQSVQRINTATDSDRLNKIFFLNDDIGFVVGGQRFNESVILSTYNGGQSWQKQMIPNAQKGLYDMVQAPSSALYIIGFDGKLLRSYDTGRTWIFRQLEYFAYTGIAFTDADHAIVAGGVSFSSGILEYIDSVGNKIKRDSVAYQFNKIVMVNNSTGYLCGYGIMKKTTDGGRTWTFLNVDKDNFTYMDVHGDEIWMCGYNGGIYHTANGGYNWERLRNGNDITIPHYHLYCIIFKDSRHGWAAGEEGKLIYTDDGGKHWEEFDHFTNSTLRSIAVRPDGSLLVAGDNGALFRIIPQ